MFLTFKALKTLLIGLLALGGATGQLIEQPRPLAPLESSIRFHNFALDLDSNYDLAPGLVGTNYDAGLRARICRYFDGIPNHAIVPANSFPESKEPPYN